MNKEQLEKKREFCEVTKHDYDNPVRKNRAYWVCPKCGKDISLEVFLIYEAEHGLD